MSDPAYLEALARAAELEMPRAEALRLRICAKCGAPPDDPNEPLYLLSGLCPTCFGKVTDGG